MIGEIINPFVNETSKERGSLFYTKNTSNLSKFPIFQHITNFPLKNIINEPEENKDKKFIAKKRGRKNKLLENSILDKENTKNEIPTEKKYHDKFSSDNIRRKIKAFFHKYIINLLNKSIEQKIPKMRKKFVKISNRITVDLGIEYNRNLINKSIKDIIIDISNRYINREINKNCIKNIEKQKDNQDIINILNMKYKDLYVNYYLKSTKNDISDNSYESHKEKLLKEYGEEYLAQFIINAENFIEFYTNGKNRKIRKPKEVDKLEIHPDKTDPKCTNELLNINDIEKKLKNKIMVSTGIQTDIFGINKKLILFE